MNRAKLIFILGFILLSFGCDFSSRTANCPTNPNFGSDPNNAPNQTVTLTRDTVIVLERTVCFGDCPSYFVRINSDGEVYFDGNKVSYEKGRMKMQPLGPKNAIISQNQLKELLNDFNKLKIFSLKDNYAGHGVDCPSYNTDSPLVNISIRTNGATKSVRHYLGCEGTETLRNLYALEKKIDEMTNTKSWLK